MTKNYSTIGDKLQVLIQAKNDIKTNLIARGSVPEGNFSTYATAVNNIQTKIGPDFSIIGYNDANTSLALSYIQGDIDYSKSVGDYIGWEIVGSGREFFYQNNRLTFFPCIDTQYCTSMMHMFYACQNLLYIPSLNTSNVTSMFSTFDTCTNLQSIPQLDTSNVTDMFGMFQSCMKLKTIPLLDAGKVTDVRYMFNYCDSLTDIGGLKNLGMNSSLDTDGMFTDCDNLTHDSIMNIINNLYDRAAVGYSLVNLPLGEYNLNKISDAEKQIAINKGWILS